MFGRLSGWELIIILVILLLFFGARKILRALLGLPPRSSARDSNRGSRKKIPEANRQTPLFGE